MSIQLHRVEGVCQKCGFSKATFFKILSDPKSRFPKPVHVHKTIKAWKSTDIDAWIDSLPVLEEDEA